MRFVTYRKGNRVRLGAVVRDQVVDLQKLLQAHGGQTGQGAGAARGFPADLLTLIEQQGQWLEPVRAALSWAEQAAASGEKGWAGKRGVAFPLKRTELLAPIPRPTKNIVMLGRNYREHAIEGARARGETPNIPTIPVYFTKPRTAVIGHRAPILYWKNTEKLDYEAELAFVIGREGRNISQAEAYDYIFGYTIINDVTARDLQRAHGGQWFKGKSLDTFCPMGPWLVHKSAIPDPHNLRITLRVNGEPRQDSNTQHMIFDIPTIIADLSNGLTLEVGDIVSTGTPEGVGFAMTPPGLLKVGDKVEVEIEGIGLLANEVVSP
ncbi:MAG: fumarylacetoacetate hydrolase family protein [Deltaproteobacteria bacterium]|nr:fumarylacetoacetate hydrolase family protein [Deltaproteobacteria bacterium]